MGNFVSNTTKEPVFNISYTESEDVYKGLQSVEKQYLMLLTNYKFASQKSNFKDAPFAPDYFFENYLTGASDVVLFKADSVLVYHKRDKDTPTEKVTLPILANTVVDAGLIVFVRKHITELLSGEKIRINYLIPSQLKYVGFKVYADEEKQRGQEHLLVVKFIPENWKEELHESPEKLVISLDTKQVVKSTETSVITADDGTHVYGKIKYSYK